MNCVKCFEEMDPNECAYYGQGGPAHARCWYKDPLEAAIHYLGLDLIGDGCDCDECEYKRRIIIAIRKGNKGVEILRRLGATSISTDPLFADLWRDVKGFLDE